MEEQGRQQQPGQQPPQEQQPRPTSAGEPAAGSAAATAARRGLPIGLTVERGHDGGPPRLEAHFHRLRYPRLGRAFSPLRLPEQTRIVLQELDFRLLRRGSIHFQLQPQAGRHRLPLTAGEPFTVEVAPGTVVHGLVRLGSVPGGGGGDAARTATPEGLPGAGMGRAASPAQLPAPPLAGPREREPAVAARTSRETIVEEVELRFDPPLLLPNVLTTFVEVQHLFEDRRLAELLQRASALPGVQTARVVGTVAREMGGRAASFLRRRLEERFGSRLQTLLGDHLGEIEQMLGETLSDVVAGESAVVLLGRVLARSRWQPQRRQWELELAFSGQVRWFDRVSNPFEDVVLPAAVLPVPQASLDRLCSLEPLASGGFFSQRFAVLPLLQVLCAAFADVRGRLSLELDLPLLQGSGMAVDRTRLETLVRLPEHLLVNGEFLLSREDAAARPAQGAPRTDAASVDGAAPAATRLCFDLPGLSLGFAGHPEQRLEVAARASAALDLEPGERSWRRRVQAALTLQLLPGCSLPRLDLELRSTHPFARGGTCYRVLLEQLRPEGGLELAWDHHRLTIRPAGAGLRCSCRLGLPEQVFLQRGETCSSGRLQDGEFELLLQPLAENSWKASLRGRATLHHRLLARVAPIAELNIEDSLLHTHVDCVVELDGSMIARFRGPVLPDISFCRGGMLQLTLQRAEAELDGRLLTLPAGTLLTGTVHQGELAPTGPGDFALDLAWDLFGKPVLLHGRPLPDGSRSTASLLTHGLRQGELTLQVSPGGRFSFSGKREGLYGVRFFNSLLNPATDPGHLLKILSDDDALAHIVATLELFNPELTDLLSSLRELILGARTILRRENVRQPADLIPRAKISRMLSLMLVGTDELASRFSPIIQGVTEGRGVDLLAAKELLRPALADFRVDYELDGILHWLDLVTSPSEPFPRPVAREALPFATNPEYAAARDELPSAAEIYQGVQQLVPPAGLIARLAELAPYLTLEQLRYILGRGRPSWGAEHIARLFYVRDLKQRISELGEAYGGIEFAAQGANLASFLGEAVGPLPGLDPDPEQAGSDSWPPLCALGPEEVAVLLQVGLAASRQGLQAQIHNRLLTELIRSRPGSFLCEVLVEMGQHSHRALTGVLFAYLHQDQDQLEQPLDLIALLQEKLELPVPRQEDYMAGGRKARESYFQALSQLAEQVFDRAGPYLARRAHLRELRHPVVTSPVLAGPAQRGEEEARQAIAAADELGRRWLAEAGASCRQGRAAASSGRKGRPSRPPARLLALQEQARDAYCQSFDGCARLLADCPTAFQLPWLGEFWARNEEALRVLSVVRNHQQDVDQVRRWLAITAGRPELQQPRADEQELLEAVVHTLYYFPADQEQLLGDPLVRLLIDPPPGRYDFTIVTAMGVVTEGVAGRELEDALRRLEEQRGVKVVRAHTGLFRSLEHNAAQILQAVQQTIGPWGYIGYSQGCANGLLAESILRSGTPDQQRLLERFVSRNLLYSAANGSVHGTSGSRKFVRAMVEGERFLKYYQASYSRDVVDLVLRGLKAALDSAMFIDTLDGTYSLTLARASWLHRDGQFAPWAPTSLTRGIVRPEHLPEALEYLYHVHQLLSPGTGCDSQVAAEEAVGHATRIRNACTEAFARGELVSKVQATHHWSPLTAEIEQVTTPRDIALAVYQSPKDRHVFPWVDALARFGRIERIAPGEGDDLFPGFPGPGPGPMQVVQDQVQVQVQGPRDGVP